MFLCLMYMIKMMKDCLLMNMVFSWYLQVYWRWFWYICFTNKEASCVGRWAWIVHCLTCFAVSASLPFGHKWICLPLCSYVLYNTVYMYDHQRWPISAGCQSLCTCMIKMLEAWYRLLSMAKNTARKIQLEFSTMGLVIMMH